MDLNTAWSSLLVPLGYLLFYVKSNVISLRVVTFFTKLKIRTHCLALFCFLICEFVIVKKITKE